jgi:hypothetical protein
MPYFAHNLYGSLSDSDLQEYGDTACVVKKFDFNPRVEKVEKRGHKAAVLGTAITGVACANTGDTFTKNSHGLTTGQRVSIASFSAGIAAGIYFVIRVDANTFKLAASYAAAIAGTAVAVSADGTGGEVTPVTAASYRQILQVQTHIIGVSIEMSIEPVPAADGSSSGLAAIAPGEHAGAIANFQSGDNIHGFIRDAAKLLLVGELKHSRSPENPAEITVPLDYYPEIAAPV